MKAEAASTSLPPSLPPSASSSTVITTAITSTHLSAQIRYSNHPSSITHPSSTTVSPLTTFITTTPLPLHWQNNQPFILALILILTSSLAIMTLDVFNRLRSRRTSDRTLTFKDDQATQKKKRAWLLERQHKFSGSERTGEELRAWKKGKGIEGGFKEL